MLQRSIRRRRVLSAVVVLVLLFSQFLTAAYACPRYKVQQTGAHQAMPDCEGASGAGEMDPQHPLLCQASCEDEAQSSSSLVSADLPQTSVLLYLLPPAGESEASPAPAAHSLLSSLGQPPPGWPPAYLFNLVLRN